MVADQVHRARNAGSLVELRDALNALVDRADPGGDADQREAAHFLRYRMDETPTFGARPHQTAGVWSWDDSHLLVSAPGHTGHVTIVARRDV